MPAVATVQDVAARVGRPLTDDEATRAEAYIADAATETDRVAPWTTDGGAVRWENALRSVQCAVVIRAMRLPDSLLAVPPGTEQAGFPTPTTTGSIFLKRSELRQLGVPAVRAVRMTPRPLGGC